MRAWQSTSEEACGRGHFLALMPGARCALMRCRGTPQWSTSMASASTLMLPCTTTSCRRTRREHTDGDEQERDEKGDPHTRRNDRRAGHRVTFSPPLPPTAVFTDAAHAKRFWASLAKAAGSMPSPSSPCKMVTNFFPMRFSTLTAIVGTLPAVTVTYTHHSSSKPAGGNNEKTGS